MLVNDSTSKGNEPSKFTVRKKKREPNKERKTACKESPNREEQICPSHPLFLTKRKLERGENEMKEGNKRSPGKFGAQAESLQPGKKPVGSSN